MQSFRLVNVESDKPFTIGRKSDNSLVLDNLMVSRYHAVLERVNEKWFLSNHTTNSVTQVNGKDVVPRTETSQGVPAEIADGDVIQVGPLQLKVAFKGSKLSLLLMESADQEISVTKALTEKWSAIETDEVDIPKGVEAKICAGQKVAGNCNGNCAALKFKEALTNAQGKSIKQAKLAQGEALRLPGCEMEFDGASLVCRNRPHGFDVSVKNLDVFAGKKQLLHDVNFNLQAGEILAIIGRSGQGKSTLLRLLQGIHKSGENSEVRIGSLDYRNAEIRKHIAFLEQDPELRKDLTVRETLLDGGRVSMNKQDFKQNAQGRLEKFCELFGLSDRMDNAVKTLSGGESRRAALARELMGNPGLIILDEPLSGLDPFNSKILCSHLKQLSFLGHTIILTTHSYEALEIANKVLVLHQGEQGFFGSPEESYRYFETRDPEKILAGLNDETSVNWKNTFEEKKVQETMATQVNPSLKENKNKVNFCFPKTNLSSMFLYKVALTAKQWFRDKGKFIALLIQPLVIGFLFSQIFSSLTSLWIVAFAVILSANWLALSLSIREIVQEKEILRGEFRKGVSVLTTVTAKLALPTLVAWLQTLIVYLFVSIRTQVHASPAQLLLVVAAMIIPPVTVGLTVSAFSKNAGQANALLPLLIIPQVALAGALVPLDQMLPIGRALSNVIWSRYNQNSLLNLLLERQDPIENILAALAIALGCYIVMVIKIHCSKKAK